MRVAIFNDTTPEMHYGCAMVMEALVSGLTLRGMDIALMWPVGKDWRPFRAEIQASGPFSMVVLNGEGSIHGSEIRPRAHYLSEIGRFAELKLGCPAFLVNASLANNGTDIYENLSHFRRVYVRDRRSEADLRSHGVPSECVPDLSFGWAGSPRKARERVGYLSLGSVVSEVESAMNALDGFVALEKGQIFYRRDCVGRLERLSEKWGLDTCSRIRRANRRLAVGSFLKRLATHRLVITGRFHGVAACLLTKTPFVCVESNTHKISALLTDVFGDTARLIPVSDLQQINLTKYDFWDERELRSIDYYLAKARLDAHKMIDQIVKMGRQLNAGA